MPILDGYEASYKINDYLKSSHLTDLVQLGKKEQTREKVLERFNIKALPCVVALTADMNSDVSKGCFSAVFHDITLDSI